MTLRTSQQVTFSQILHVSKQKPATAVNIKNIAIKFRAFAGFNCVSNVVLTLGCIPVVIVYDIRPIVVCCIKICIATGLACSVIKTPLMHTLILHVFDDLPFRRLVFAAKQGIFHHVLFLYCVHGYKHGPVFSIIAQVGWYVVQNVVPARAIV